jgi:type VI secretion system protein VasJ
VVKDYIRIGPANPWLDEMTRWVEGGYPASPGETALHSWRFFIRGRRPKELGCGLVRDSSDGAGRPFPLLIMGSGMPERWEDRWEFLPQDLDDCWERMEQIGVRKVSGLAELKESIMRLPMPGLSGGNPGVEVSQGGTTPPWQEGMIAAALEESLDHTGQIVGLLGRIRSGYEGPPDAVFMGGTDSRSFLVVFRRALRPEDFRKLWAMG